MSARGFFVASASIALLIVACGGSYGATDAGPTTCSADACGAHGRCDDTSGIAICACDPGYVGATCATCADGLRDYGGGCVATCAKSPPCPARSTCIDTDAPPKCTCPTGYTLAGDTCLWTTTFQDPTFQQTPPDSWKVVHGALIDPFALASDDPGRGRFACAGGGDAEPRFSQDVMMPKLADAEPLAIAVTAQVDGGIPFGGTSLVAMGLRYGDAWTSVLLPAATRTALTPTRLCLGDAAYDGKKTFAFGQLCAFAPSGTVSSLSISHADIVRAPECPLPGVVRGGDFGTPDAWTTSPSSEIVGGAGHLVAGVTGYGCSSSRLETVASVPSAMTGPAVTVTTHGKEGGIVEVAFGEFVAGRIPITAATTTTHVCLPPWTRGVAGALVLGPPTGRCDVDAYADDVAIVDDPGCVNAFVADGGFENTTMSPWDLSPSGTLATATFDAAAPHGGDVALKLNVLKTCGMATATQIVAAPKGGGAVTFWYKTSGTTTSFTVSGNGPLAPSADYVQARSCLTEDGIPETVSFALLRPNLTCTTALDTALYIDDVRVVPDATCKPANP